METVIAIAACALLAVQTHRNYLMVQASKKSATNVINVVPAEVDYDALARAMEGSWPAVTVSNDFEIDYNKLGDAIKKALIESEVAVHNAVVSEPVVVYSTPDRSITVPVSEVFEPTNLSEINGIPVRKFPSR